MVKHVNHSGSRSESPWLTRYVHQLPRAPRHRLAARVAIVLEQQRFGGQDGRESPEIKRNHELMIAN